MVLVQRQTKPARVSFLIAAAVAVVPILLVACKGRLTVAECEALWSTADRDLAKVVAHHATCVRDEDCELVQQPYGCLWACQTAIAHSGRAAYDATQTRLRSAECNDWQRGGCLETTPKAVPSCASLTARCQDSRCAAVFEPRR